MVLLPAPLGPEMMTGRVSNAGLDDILLLERAYEELEIGVVAKDWRCAELCLSTSGCCRPRRTVAGRGETADGAKKVSQTRVGAREQRITLLKECQEGVGCAS